MENRLSWPHVRRNLLDWLNKFVLPKIKTDNEKRVLDAIPVPPRYDTVTLLNNVFVIESESCMLQGTAFYLKGLGVITCDHCVRNPETGQLIDDLLVYRGNDLKNKYKPRIRSANKDIDLALLDVDPKLLGPGLEIGESDSLIQLDHIAVAGFPNYNFGDNGFFSPGLIVGFRAYTGLRHMLVNIAIVAGNSGGPAFDKTSKVIGIAVTGTDRFSNAQETEKHALIPIEALKFLITAANSR